MKIFSTFTGIGGFEIGIQSAWLSNVQAVRGGQEATQGVDEERQGLHAISSERTIPTSRRDNEHTDARIDEGQPHCVGYSKIDKYAIWIKNKPHNNIKVTGTGDGLVTDIDLEISK